MTPIDEPNSRQSLIAIMAAILLAPKVASMETPTLEAIQQNADSAVTLAKMLYTRAIR